MTKVLIAHWPRLCDECGQAVAEKVGNRPDLDAITVYCGHQRTVAMAYCTVIEGRRAVYSWDVQGPIEPDEAEHIINRLGAASASIENLDAGRLN